MILSSLIWSNQTPSNVSASMYSWMQRAYFPPPSVSLEVNHIRIVRGIEDPFMNRLTNLVDLNLSFEADFRKLFHWNTKQLFLYLVLEYETPQHHTNQIVVWDRIIQRRGDNHRISISKLKNKYPANDINDLLQGRNAVLKLYWNTVPWVGLLYDTQHGSVTAKIPEYVQQ